MKQIELTFETKRLCISEIKTEITGTFISAKEINNQIIHQEMREWPPLATGLCHTQSQIHEK